MRNVQMDNLRGVLIFFVVFGHLIESGLQKGDLVRDLYVLIYLFHMPLFVGVSGYFSSTRVDYRKIFRGIITPYVAAELLYRSWIYYMTGNMPALLTPYWLLWFLVSLACWRLMIPFWMRLPFPALIAIVLSLIVGCIDWVGYPLSLSRTVYFFPFFVIGHQLSGCDFDKLKNPAVSVLVVLVASVAVHFIPEDYSVKWLYGSRPYAAFGVTDLVGALTRLVHYTTSFAMCVAVLGLIPKRESAVTRLGRNTMPIFLGHGLIVLALRGLGYGETDYIFVTAAFLSLMICGVGSITFDRFNRRRWLRF